MHVNCFLTTEAAISQQSFLRGHVFYWRYYTDGNIQGHNWQVN